MTGQTRRSSAYHANREWEARQAEHKAEVKHHWDYKVKHFLYRCYDADGVLLYIGCTRDVGTRLQVHASSWQNPASAYLNLRMARYEVEGPFAGRIAGRKAEKDAIAAEQPYLNLHHNKGRGAKRERGPEVGTPEWDAELRRAGALLESLLFPPAGEESA